MQIELITVFLTGLIALIGVVAGYFLRGRKGVLRQAVRLPPDEPAPAAGRRYKEIFDNGSDGVFVVEVLPSGKFGFESLNPAAVQAICPRGVDLAGRRLDKIARQESEPELTRFLEILQRQLSQCIASGLPAEYECKLRVSSDGARNLLVKLVPMADDGGISHILCFAQDITARKLYEHELLERVKLEERLSGFVASAPGFFYTYRHGANGSNAMPFASAGIHALFGLRPENVALSIAPMNLLIHPDDLQGVIDATANSAVALSPLEIEFRVQHPKRGEVWVESRALPKSEPDGSIVWHGFMHDISERKSVEQRLHEAHEFASGVIDAISDPIFVKDRKHRWLMLNDAFCELIGHSKDELIGKSDYDFFPTEQADEFWAGDERVFASGKTDLNEEAFTDADGKTHFIQTKKSLLKRNGAEYLIGSIRDITGRRKMEIELRRNRENLAEAQRIGQMGSWELDLATGELTWSDEIYRLFEIDHDLFGESYEAFLNAVHPDDREAVDRAYRDSLETRNPYCIDHRLLFPDGRIKHVRECCETRYGADGKPVRSHGTVQDITVLKETELRLQETQDKLRELVISREALIETERKRIAWEMHEELGQLLAAMRLRVHGMRNHFPENIPALNESYRAVDSLIERSIKTVLGIVSDLRPTVLMHGPAAALEWLVAREGERHGIACELAVDEDGTIAGDELTLLVFRIAQEAIENIARHTGVNSVMVSWACNSGGYCLKVRHDGENHGGAPAGLPLLSLFGMQERVAAFGGEMKILDMPEDGTVIEARFPIRDVDDIQYPLFGNVAGMVG
ncbi:MAG TPA: PAS domain S-box protein [Gallionella sp.]|nr:PAS domain S-box protein [Gallionella sp.]